jgi:PAS domain S-box-containing protein
MGDIVYKVNADGEFVYVNRCVRSLGYDPKELLGQHFSSIVHPDDVERVSRQIVLPRFVGTATGDEEAPKLFDERRSGRRMTRGLEIRLIPKGWHEHKDDDACRVGTAVTVGEVSSAGQYDDEVSERVFLGTVGTIRDVTDHRKTERALREQEVFTRAALDAQKDTFAVFSAEDGGPLWWNRALQEATGISDDDIGTRSILDLHPEEDRNRIARAIADVLDSGSATVEACLCTHVGTHVTYEFSMVLIRDLAGRPKQILSVGRDVSERKRMEEGQIRTEKLECIAVLAAGIAHDFNNTLTGVTGCLSLAKMLSASCPDVQGVLGQAERAAFQAKAQTEQLLTFSKGGEPVTQPTSVSDLIGNSVGLLLSGSRARCDVSVPDDLWAIEADRVKIQAAIDNLLLNAVQAMPRGGTVWISAANTMLAHQNPLSLAAGPYVRICVRDEGVGIPQDLLSRIFDPYFTTKERGSGLGLAASYSVVKKHGGDITVQSEVGVGSMFAICIPAAQGDVMGAETRESTVPHGKAKVLIVDDNEVVRRTATQMLLRIGYEPHAAGDGLEALELCSAAACSGQPFEAAIVDLTVPGDMGGEEILKKLHEIAPDLKGIISSGYSEHPVLAAYRENGFAARLQKPYTLEDIGRTLRDALSGGAYTPPEQPED